MGRLPTSARKHLTADYARSSCGRSILGPGFNSRRLHSKEVQDSPAASSKWAPLLHLASNAVRWRLTQSAMSRLRLRRGARGPRRHWLDVVDGILRQLIDRAPSACGECDRVTGGADEDHHLRGRGLRIEKVDLRLRQRIDKLSHITDDADHFLRVSVDNHALADRVLAIANSKLQPSAISMSSLQL